MCIENIYTTPSPRAHTAIYNIFIYIYPYDGIYLCWYTRVTTRRVGGVNDLTDVWLGRP